MHEAGADAGNFERDDEEGYTGGAGGAGADSGCYVVSPDRVGDPFLGAVHDVAVAFADGGRFDVCNVGTSCEICQWRCYQVDGPGLPSGSVIPRQNLIVPFATPGRNLSFCA